MYINCTMTARIQCQDLKFVLHVGKFYLHLIFDSMCQLMPLRIISLLWLQTTPLFKRQHGIGSKGRLWLQWCSGAHN